MMINKIINEFKKITKEVYQLDILMDHIKNNYLEEKWVFTLRTYHNLETEINNYLNPLLSKNVNLNYIINDYETLTQMILEYKEDIYHLFNPNLFLLIDGLNNNLLKELSIIQKQILNEYKSFKMYSCYIYKNPIKNVLIQLKNELEQLEDINIKKYINFDKIKNLILYDEYNLDIYITIYQLFTKTIKYVQNNNELEDIYKQIRFNTIMITSGDINV